MTRRRARRAGPLAHFCALTKVDPGGIVDPGSIRVVEAWVSRRKHTALADAAGRSGVPLTFSDSERITASQGYQSCGKQPRVQSMRSGKPERLAGGALPERCRSLRSAALAEPHARAVQRTGVVYGHSQIRHQDSWYGSICSHESPGTDDRKDNSGTRPQPHGVGRLYHRAGATSESRFLANPRMAGVVARSPGDGVPHAGKER